MMSSVVLPTRNAEWCLPYSLKMLLEQVVQPDEYVVCIGKSEDKTEELILDFQKKCSVPVRLCYDREGIGTGYAMSLSLSKAKGDIILWASSDGIKSKHWVERMMGFFVSNENLSYLCNSGTPENPSKISEVDPEKIPASTELKYTNGADPLSGIIAFRRKDAIEVGGFDPLFTRGQDFDLVIRLSQAGKIGADCGSEGYHFGIYGMRNTTKALKTGTFFRFFYKYGWRYCLLCKHHFFGVLLRTGFLFSIIMILLSLAIGSIPSATLFGLTLALSIFGLCYGVIVSHGKLSLNLLVFQFLESIGEYKQLWILIKNKNKPEFGYGKKWLK